MQKLEKLLKHHPRHEQKRLKPLKKFFAAKPKNRPAQQVPKNLRRRLTSLDRLRRFQYRAIRWTILKKKINTILARQALRAIGSAGVITTRVAGTLARLTPARTRLAPFAALYVGSKYRRRFRYDMQHKYRLKLAATEKYRSISAQPRLVVRGVSAHSEYRKGSSRARYLSYARTRSKKQIIYFRKLLCAQRLQTRHSYFG